MNKTIRDKALRGTNRLITCAMNGEEWYAPDGYFATAYPIYDGYKVKKHQRELLKKEVDLLDILPKTGYIPAKFTEAATLEGKDTIKITATKHNTGYHVNKDHWLLLKNIYPEAIPFVGRNGEWNTPVKLFSNDKLVAVIMPIKSW